MLSKDGLRKRFASGYKDNYAVRLFEEEGFQRKACEKCGKGFWTLDPERKDCGDSSHTPYGFFRKEPRKETYASFWKKFADFWDKNGHEVIPRYPVLSRWRDDLPFTIASIVDFQRIEEGKVVFEYPANPLLVPQICLRFPDIANIGVTGAHFSCFMMAGQHTFNYPKEGYWRDECIDYNYRFLTGVLGVEKEELIYGEDVWNMPDFSAFGPSIESFAHGLELVNSVFMQYRAKGEEFEDLDMKVIDVGWGFERVLWYYNGTRTAYDSVFPREVEFMKNKSSIELDPALFNEYCRLASSLNVDNVVDLRQERQKIAADLGISLEELNKGIAPMQAVYAIADHSRALLFALSDGSLPSNSAGGYNLRVLLRRALSFINEYGFDFELMQLVRLHAEDLKSVFPELSENLDSIQGIIEAETRKYGETMKKAGKMAEEVVARKEPLTTKKMTLLYESHGVTPELLEKAARRKGVELAVPSGFYEELTGKHVMEKGASGEDSQQEPGKKLILPPLPPTRQAYYTEQEARKHDARIVFIDAQSKAVVLDETIFYPEGGGQCADHGLIQGKRVLDVQKQGDSIIHYVEDVDDLTVGEKVLLQLDWDRREAITRHHSATHVIIATARKLLGNHVWQAGSHKDEDVAHIDLTHFEKPSADQIRAVELKANEVVREAHPIRVRLMDRRDAEKEYGFRLYQGGGAVRKIIRVLDIEGVDVEACGGLHRKNTSEIGFIKIAGVESIQDGVVRLYFKAGSAAIKHVQEQENLLDDACAKLSVSRKDLPKSTARLFEEWKSAQKELAKNRLTVAEMYGLRLVDEAKRMGKNQVNKEVPFGDARLLDAVANAIARETGFSCVLWNSEGVIVASANKESGEDAVQLLKAAGAKGGGAKDFARGKRV